MRGSILAAWRKDLGWSQEHLANELGIDRQMIDDLEHSADISPLIESVLASLRSTLAEMKGEGAERAAKSKPPEDTVRKRRSGAKPVKRAPDSVDAEFAAANAKFDRLLGVMAKTPALPKKKRRVVERQVPDEKFDD